MVTAPVTVTDCAAATPAPLPRAKRPRSSVLRCELAEIFRIEALEVGLEGVGIERAARAFTGSTRPGAFTDGVGGLDDGVLQQLVVGEDGGLEPERQGDGVRRPGV